MNQYTHKYEKVSSCMKNGCFMPFFIDLTEFHRNYILTAKTYSKNKLWIV